MDSETGGIKIVLDSLAAGLPTLTKNEGAFLAETAQFCLENNGHLSGVEVKVELGNGHSFVVDWNSVLDPRAEYSYRDFVEVVEFGATAIAILYVVTRTEFNTVERSVRGGGFDYWVGTYSDESLPPFSKSQRLEISGIFDGDLKALKSRFAIKAKQTKKSDSSNTGKIVFVVEFSQPAAAVEHSQ